MSIQSTFNQGLAMAAGLVALNPTIQAKAQDRQELNKANNVINKTDVAIDEAMQEGLTNNLFFRDMVDTNRTAKLKKMYLDPDYAKDELWVQDMWERLREDSAKKAEALKKAEASALDSLNTNSQAMMNLRQAMEDRENILRMRPTVRRVGGTK